MAFQKVFLFSALIASALAARLSIKREVSNVAARRLAREETGERTQVADCYDNYQGSGAQFHATDYVPSLRSYNWDNRISSCCFTGIWILYGEEDYNEYSTGAASWWAFGVNSCMDVPSQFNNEASSLRFTGAPDDYLYDTLNIYFNDYFIGDEEFMYTDMPAVNYDNRARSVIVTGCSPWTLYQYVNYDGNAICVFPGDSLTCTPGYYTSSQSLGSLVGSVSSARKGCYAREKVFPVNYGVKLVGNGTSGFFSPDL
eukprot:GFUD01016809.1.p1 GENE.GFUD01016809.1~~GFUD01016809.1.p1  ORF type:complete len:257 (-),score=51.80 GFUD01016809.1:84-854(-)